MMAAEAQPNFVPIPKLVVVAASNERLLQVVEERSNFAAGSVVDMVVDIAVALAADMQEEVDIAAGSTLPFAVVNSIAALIVACSIVAVAVALVDCSNVGVAVAAFVAVAIEVVVCRWSTDSSQILFLISSTDLFQMTSQKSLRATFAQRTIFLQFPNQGWNVLARLLLLLCKSLALGDSPFVWVLARVALIVFSLNSYRATLKLTKNLASVSISLILLGQKKR